MLFKLQLLISFIVGGLCIALQTLIGERVKGVWRNIVLVIPSTVAIGMLFIGITKTPADVADAALIGPAALGPVYIFVAVFALLSKLNLFICLLAALTGWAIYAGVLITYPPENFYSSTLLYAAPFAVVMHLIVSALPQNPNLKPFPMSVKYIFIRSLIGGAVISIAVFLAKSLGNYWGGLFSSFPAVFSSTFIIYYISQGRSVIPSVAKSMFFPGFYGLSAFSIAAAFSFPKYGVWVGIIFSYFCSFAVYTIYYLITEKRILSFSKNLVR